jgi:hypothetical protein
MTLAGMEEGRQRDLAAKEMGEAKCVDSLPDPNVDLWADVQKIPSVNVAIRKEWESTSTFTSP